MTQHIPRWVTAALVALVAVLCGVGAAIAAASSTGTNVACATATAKPWIGKAVTATNCVTQTYTIPTVTTTVTASSTASTTSSTTTTAPSAPQPTGDPGNWTLAFDDEFNGTSLDTTKWSCFCNQNSNVVGTLADVSEANGLLSLDTTANGTTSGGYGSGGFITTKSFQLPVGGFMEASIDYPGSGTTLDNWDGFWASGASWPANGEEDVLEGLGTATSNYHSPDGANNSGTIAGTWSNAYHTYGMYRGQNTITIYWDGKVVRTYSRTDSGGAQNILLDSASNTGPDNTVNSPSVLGAAGAMKVDYVRAWVPAS